MASMKNTHELSALSGNGQGPTLALVNNSKDFLIKTNQRSSVRWTTPAATSQTPPSSVTATTALETSSAEYNGGTDTNYLANRAAIMSWQQQQQQQQDEKHYTLQQPQQQQQHTLQSTETINYLQQHRTSGNGSLLHNTLTNGNSNNISCTSNTTITSGKHMNNNLNLILNANAKSVLFNTSTSDYVTESCKDASSFNKGTSSTIVGSVGVGVAVSGSSSKSTTSHNNDKTWL